jgi:hypothetical protein
VENDRHTLSRLEDYLAIGYSVQNVLGDIVIGKLRPDGTFAPAASGKGRTISEAVQALEKILVARQLQSR